MTSRRQVLTYGVPAMAFAAAGSLPQAALAKASDVITRKRYDKYIELYNAVDPAFTSLYTDDAVMETVPPLKGAAAIAEFRKNLAYYITEHITVEYYVADETGAAAQLLGEFRCVRDMPITALSGLFGREVKQGQVMRQRGIILYGVKGGKFQWIRASPPIVLQDWG